MTALALPLLAYSVRQPWAWAICAGHKRFENRSQASVRNMPRPLPGRIAIHAARGMTRDEYENAAEFMASLSVICPPPADLPRGGIVGAVNILGVCSLSDDPWFFGPAGIKLFDAEAITPVPALGALGIFRWSPSGQLMQPARWMTDWLPRSAAEAGR